MNELFLLALLVFNFGISWHNAWSVGRFWTESKIAGGGIRLLVWCGVIMSAVGFTWCYLTLVTILGIITELLTYEQAEALFALGYLIILVPLIGSGAGIWVNSLVRAYRTRKLGDVAVAGYNTFAQAHNVINAARHAPGMMDIVGKFFLGGGKGKRRSKDSGGLVVILLVILVVLGGSLTTAAIVNRADAEVVLEMTRGETKFL